jgi:hypothetical protein
MSDKVLIISNQSSGIDGSYQLLISEVSLDSSKEVSFYMIDRILEGGELILSGY